MDSLPVAAYTWQRARGRTQAAQYEEILNGRRDQLREVKIK